MTKLKATTLRLPEQIDKKLDSVVKKGKSCKQC